MIVRRKQWCSMCDRITEFRGEDGFCEGDAECCRCALFMAKLAPEDWQLRPGDVDMGIGGDLKQQASEPKPGGHPEFHRILDEMRALHVKKAADYGLGTDVLANCRGSTEFGIPAWVGVAMRMNDKMTRVKALAQHGELKNEPIVDSFLDIACYAIIGLILYREQKEKSK